MAHYPIRWSKYEGEKITFRWVTLGLSYPPPPQLKICGDTNGLCPVHPGPALQCKVVIWSDASPLTVPLRGSYAQPYIALQISYGVWRLAPPFLRSETHYGLTEN